MLSLRFQSVIDLRKDKPVTILFLNSNFIILAGTPSLGFTQEPLSELQKAMKSKDGKLMQAILQSFNAGTPEARSEVTKVDENGRTVLMLSIRDRMGFPIIKRLLGLGADLNQSDKDGRTPLFYAASKGRLDLALGMIKIGSKINHTDRFGWTPLGQIIMAITNEQEQFKALRAFLKAGASLEFQFPNDPGAYPSPNMFDRLESRSLLTWAIEFKSKRLTRIILDHMKTQSSNPSWVNGVDDRGRTPLHSDHLGVKICHFCKQKILFSRHRHKITSQNSLLL